MSMTGEYREIGPPLERAVRTESFETGCIPQMGEQLTTLVLTENTGKATLTLTVQYPSNEARDGALASGMSAGYDRLHEILETVSV